MSAPTVAEAEAVNFETAFHLDKDVASEDPENYLVIHELMGRGQLLNAYEVSPLLLKNFSKHCILDPHARACIVAGRARARARFRAPFSFRYFFSRIRSDSASFSVVFPPHSRRRWSIWYVLSRLMIPEYVVLTPLADGERHIARASRSISTPTTRFPDRRDSTFRSSLTLRFRCLAFPTALRRVR